MERNEEITLTLAVLERVWRMRPELGLSALVFEANPHGLPWKTSDATLRVALNALVRPMGCTL
jgi:hypothetical protein